MVVVSSGRGRLSDSVRCSIGVEGSIGWRRVVSRRLRQATMEILFIVFL
jgi:hypothetical protein